MVLPTRDEPLELHRGELDRVDLLRQEPRLFGRERQQRLAAQNPAIDAARVPRAQGSEHLRQRAGRRDELEDLIAQSRAPRKIIRVCLPAPRLATPAANQARPAAHAPRAAIFAWLPRAR